MGVPLGPLTRRHCESRRGRARHDRARSRQGGHHRGPIRARTGSLRVVAYDFGVKETMLR